MTTKNISIISLTLLTLAVFYFAWLKVFEPCSSPVNIISLPSKLNIANPHSLMTGKEVQIFVAELAPGEKEEGHYYDLGRQSYLIVSGQAILHSGRLNGEEIEWARDAQVKKNDFIEIQPKIVTQIENNGSDPLIYVVTLTENSNEDKRHRVEDFDVLNSRCNKN